MRAPQSITVNEDTRLIPVWSILAAAAVFILVEYYFWCVLPMHVDRPIPPFGIRIYFGISWGLVAALYILMVGYISKDAPRRAMSSRFWMLISFAMPVGIGAVLYFLLRAPLVSLCPACGTHVQGDFHFCPQCARPLTVSCSTCFSTMRPTDQFCTRCGHELACDQKTTNLRVLGE
jgi:hypothetical protein